MTATDIHGLLLLCDSCHVDDSNSIRLNENMIEYYWVRFLSVFFLILLLTRMEFELRGKIESDVSHYQSDHVSELQDRIRINSTNLNDNMKICPVELVIMIL